MKLGDMMKAYRAEHKYTLRDFAEVCGISFAQVRLMEKERKKLSEKLRRLVDLYTDGMIDRADYDRRRKDIDEKLETLDPAPELPNITTDFSGMYSKLSPERKNVFWKAFLDHVSVSKAKEVNIAFHTAKVLAERMGMIEMQEK